MTSKLSCFIVLGFCQYQTGYLPTKILCQELLFQFISSEQHWEIERTMRQETEFFLCVCVWFFQLLFLGLKKIRKIQQGTQTPAGLPKQLTLAEQCLGGFLSLGGCCHLFKLLCPSGALQLPCMLRGLKARCCCPTHSPASWLVPQLHTILQEGVLHAPHAAGCRGKHGSMEPIPQGEREPPAPGWIALIFKGFLLWYAIGNEDRNNRLLSAKSTVTCFKLI